MVGGGIFSVLGLTVQLAGAGAYLSFVVGGVVAALTGFSYARLSVAIHSRGGTASFLDRAFGTRVAGPLNLLLWLSYFVMLGLYAVAFGSYLAALLGLDPSGGWRQLLGSAVIVCFAALNLAGAQVVGRAESVLVYFNLGVLLVFSLGGLAFVDTARVSPSAFPSIGSIVYAGRLIFLAYEGFELIANASEDARQPKRTLPRAYAIAIGSVICLYVLVAFVAVGNLSPEGDRLRARLHARRSPPAVPGVGRVQTRDRSRGLDRQRNQRHPLWRREVHVPDGPRGGATRAAWPTDLEQVDRRPACDHAWQPRDRQHGHIEGISLMGSAGFLIIFAAVNLASGRLTADSRRTKVIALAGAIACLGLLAALVVYAATHIPGQLGGAGLWSSQPSSVRHSSGRAGRPPARAGRSRHTQMNSMGVCTSSRYSW